jgi:hypothetical protein
VRKLGYKHIATTDRGELNCVRPLQGDYPRFHIYLSPVEENKVLNFSLHLDQRKTVYEGATAHGGDYDSEVVKEESERIKGLMHRMG